MTYSYYDINIPGVALAQDKEFRYSHVEKGTDIIICSVQIGKWKRSRNLFSGYKWTADYSSSTVETLTGSQLKSQYERAYNRLISVINGKDGSNLNLLLDSFFQTPLSKSEILDIASASHGYQVRCVKE